MPTAISKDGTAIVYDKTGKGPGIILVNGALSHRCLSGEKELAAVLSRRFTVIWYDRRGRGESGDTKPYSVEKEIQDLDALVDVAGGSACLYGCSSGAALSLLAAHKLGAGKITRLALYEPPYGFQNDRQEFRDLKNKINEIVSASRPGDAVTYFMESLGTPPEAIQGMKQAPNWKEMERVGHTLVYDFEVLGDGAVPYEIVKKITIPTLVIDGEKSFDFMHPAADAVGKAIAGAERKTLKGQTHEVKPEVLGPVIEEFFSR